MEELTIIIPIHRYDQTIGQYLNRAIQSVDNQIEKPNNILIVAPKEVTDILKQPPDTTSIGVKLIEKTNPDLVLLDISMPDGTGFELLDKLKLINFKLIFITALLLSNNMNIFYYSF